MASMVVVEHADGRRYAVDPKAFEKHRDGEFKGFKAIGHENGDPYNEPAAAGPDPVSTSEVVPDTKGKAK